MIARIAAGLLLAAAALGGGEAKACFFLAPARLGGPPPSEAERLAEEKSGSAHQVRYLTREAAKELANGTKAARQLAEMLVPNARPVPIHKSDCGPTNEVDVADGDEKPHAWLAGTRHAARAQEFEGYLRRADGATFGTMCNSEMRERFAAHLRRSMETHELRAAYIFLRARWDPGEPRRRLIAFEGGTRRPPIRWIPLNRWHRSQIARWIRSERAGRSLQAAVDSFWTQTASALEDNARLCPRAVATWPVEQSKWVAEIDALLEKRRQAREPAPGS